MEKVSFKNSRGLTVVGNLHTALSNSLIFLLHGFTGDKSEFGRFDLAAHVLENVGYSILAFDFSGSGEGEDDSLTVGKQVDDFHAARNFAEKRGFTKFGVVGLSLGALVALRTYGQNISAMVLWTPVTAPLKDPRVRYTREELHELDETGFITKVKATGPRRSVVIDKQMLEERRNVNQEALLSTHHSYAHYPWHTRHPRPA